MIKPILQALLLADNVYIDGPTGKKVIAGTFNYLSASEFPSEYPGRKSAFLSLTDFRGTLSITLKYVDLRENHTLFELRDILVKADNPLETVEVVVQVPKLPMPHPGVYAFEAHIGDNLMGCLRITVTESKDRLNPLDN